MATDQIYENFESQNLNQDFEEVVPGLYQYLQTEQYQEALEILDNFSRTKADKDGSHGVKHKCDSWKALIFEKQGRYQEALSLYQALAQGMGAKPTFLTYLQVDIARVLHKLGNHQEAITEIEKALEEPVDSSISDRLTALNLYVNILEEFHEKLPIQYQYLVQSLADDLGIEGFSNGLLEPSSLNQSIREVSQKNQEANRRYSRMLIELDKIEEDDQVEGLLRKYISQETVGYYRNLAIQELDDSIYS